MKKQKPVKTLFMSTLAGADMNIKEPRNSKCQQDTSCKDRLAILILYLENLIP